MEQKVHNIICKYTSVCVSVCLCVASKHPENLQTMGFSDISINFSPFQSGQATVQRCGTHTGVRGKPCQRDLIKATPSSEGNCGVVIFRKNWIFFHKFISSKHLQNLNRIGGGWVCEYKCCFFVGKCKMTK